MNLRTQDEIMIMQGFIACDDIEPATCNHFGCGKHLSLQEQLFSKYCINHQNKTNANIVHKAIHVR